MSAMENTLAAAPGNEEQLQELHRTMKARARRKNRTQKGVLLTLNTFMAIFMMLPLLYAISVALMPANELNSMAMNLVPSHSSSIPLSWRAVSPSDRSSPVLWQLFPSPFWSLRAKISCLCW